MGRAFQGIGQKKLDKTKVERAVDINAALGWHEIRYDAPLPKALGPLQICWVDNIGRGRMFVNNGRLLAGDNTTRQGLRDMKRAGRIRLHKV
jgi:hypothetical protein